MAEVEKASGVYTTVGSEAGQATDTIVPHVSLRRALMPCSVD